MHTRSNSKSIYVNVKNFQKFKSFQNEYPDAFSIMRKLKENSEFYFDLHTKEGLITCSYQYAT